MDDDADLYARTYNPTDDFQLEDDEEKPYAHHALPEVNWFHGKLSREDAARVLGDAKIGSFLVRESLSSAGEYSISFRAPSGVKHFKVMSHEMGDFFIADERFSSLSQVVEFYSNEYLCDNLSLQHAVAPRAPQQSSSRVRPTVIALQDYTAASADEISFRRGDIMIVLHGGDEHWMWAALEGSAFAGFVPRHIVREVGTAPSEREARAASQLPPHFHRSKWLHGRIARQAAEDLLKNKPVGTFLVRESENSPGDYGLSFRLSRHIEHFKIDVSLDRALFKCGNRDFDSLDAVVLRYINEPLQEGTTLMFPLAEVAPRTLLVADSMYSVVQTTPAAATSHAGRAGGSLPPPLPPKSKSLYESVTRLRATSMASPVARSAAPQPVNAATGGMTGAATLGASAGASAGASTGAGGAPVPSGYVKAGYAAKKEKKGKVWMNVYFTLHAGLKRLYFFDSENAVKPKGIIDLTVTTVFSLDDSFFGRPNCFQLLVQSADVFVCCNTEQDRREWLVELAKYSASVGFGADIDATKASQIRSLALTVSDAKKISAKCTDAYCIISLNHVNFARTSTKPVKNQTVMWAEEFFFDNIAVNIEHISISLWNRKKGKDQELGVLSFLLSSLVPGVVREKWDELGSGAGAVLAKVTFKDEVVQPEQEYADFRHLLLEPDLGTAQMLGDVPKINLNELARQLLVVWRTATVDVPMLGQLAEAVVAGEKDAATLFRGNSLATKAMDHYMKMIAIPYLHAAGHHVRVLFEDKRSCELDPTRKGRPENVKVLLEHCSRILADLYARVEAVPAELRTVLARVQAAVARRWPRDPTVGYTAVSAFVFLRLVVPAVMNPKLFNMMPDFATEEIARHLVLVAKVLQTLANMSEFGQKEPFMTVCNSFLAAERPRMQKFLNTLATPGGTPAPVLTENPSRALATLARMCAAQGDILPKLLKNSGKSAKRLPDILKKLRL